MSSVRKINEVFLEKQLDCIDKNKFGKFDGIRNEIYHRSFEIPWDKDTEIRNFLSEFKKFYESGFGEHLDTESVDMMSKFSNIHSQRRST